MKRKLLEESKKVGFFLKNNDLLTQQNFISLFRILGFGSIVCLAFTRWGVGVSTVPYQDLEVLETEIFTSVTFW